MRMPAILTAMIVTLSLCGTSLAAKDWIFDDGPFTVDPKTGKHVDQFQKKVTPTAIPYDQISLPTVPARTSLGVTTRRIWDSAFCMAERWGATPASRSATAGLAATASAQAIRPSVATLSNTARAQQRQRNFVGVRCRSHLTASANLLSRNAPQLPSCGPRSTGLAISPDEEQ